MLTTIYISFPSYDKEYLERIKDFITSSIPKGGEYYIYEDDEVEKPELRDEDFKEDYNPLDAEFPDDLYDDLDDSDYPFFYGMRIG